MFFNKLVVFVGLRCFLEKSADRGLKWIWCIISQNESNSQKIHVCIE